MAASSLRTSRIGGQLDPAWLATSVPWTHVRATATLSRPDTGAPIVDPTNGAHEHPTVTVETLTAAQADGQWRTTALKPTTSTGADLALQPTGLTWTITLEIKRGATWHEVIDYTVAPSGDRNYSGLSETVTVAGASCIDINALIPPPTSIPPGDAFETAVLEVLDDHPEYGAADLTVSRTSTTVTVVSATGTDATLPAATTSLAGQLTAADKVTLDGSASSIAAAVSTTAGTGDAGKLVKLATTGRLGPAMLPAYTTDRPLDPRDEYGGIGDGSSHPLSSLYGTLGAAQAVYPHATALTDEIDWCAIQGVINDSVTTGNPAGTIRLGRRPVLLASGDWVINKPIAITSVQDFTFEGMGSSTNIRLGGGGLTAMLDINGAAFCTFGKFQIADVLNTSYDTTRAIWLRWDGAARSTTGNNFRDILIRNIRYTRAGVEIGSADNAGVQVDNSRWYGVSVSGDPRWHNPGGAAVTAVGFHVGDHAHGNNLLHSFFGCTANGNSYGLYIDATDSLWIGGSITYSSEADIFYGSTQFAHISGIRSEHSARLLVSDGPSSAHSQLLLENVIFTAVSEDLAADLRLIYWILPGSLVLNNITVVNPDGDALTIRANPTQPLSLVSNGVGIGGRTMAQVYDVNSNVRNRVMAYVNTLVSSETTSIESNVASVTSGATGARPTGVPTGFEFWDSTLGKPIWWNGTVWKDAAGTTV